MSACRRMEAPMRHTHAETWPISDAAWREFAERFAEQWKIARRRAIASQHDGQAR